MKIKYDMTKNYFKYYNESQGIMISKNEILKNPKSKLYSYTEKGIINLLLVILTGILSKILYYLGNNGIVTKVLNIIVIIALLLLLLYFTVFYIGYFIENRKKHVGNLEIDADGIRDLSDNGMVVGFSWNNIKAIIIRKHTINIITDNSIYFFIDVTYKERLLIAIERYNKDLLIIDKSK